MTLPAAVALATVLLAVYLAVSNANSFFIPRWKQHRWFALLAMSAAVYSGANGLLTLRVSDSAIVMSSAISIAAAAVHVLAWIHYAEADLASLSPRFQRLADAGFLLLAAVFPVVGLTGHVVSRAAPFLAITYRVAEATVAGSVCFLLLLAGLVLTLSRYVHAAIRGVPHAKAHAVAIAILVAAGAHDAAVTLGIAAGPYLIDPAFFVSIAVVGLVMSQRWANDVRALDRAIASRDEFIAVAAHELKTPLTPLKLQVELLQRAPAGDEVGWLEGRVRDANRQIERLKRLVDELLDVSRIDTGRFRLELASVDLGGVIREIVERFQRSHPQRMPIDIQMHSDEPIVGQWDRLRLEQVISNLLDNAVKFGGGNAIEVRVSADASEATLAITDHGIGIPPADQQRIFERFERAVPARRYGGLGLGLYISRQIVEMLSGHISVTSQPRSGTTFAVTLPLRPSTAATSHAS